MGSTTLNTHTLGLEPLEPRLLLNGVTLITHGYQALSSDRPAWLDAMAAAIVGRAGADTAVYALRIERASGGGAQVTAFNRLSGPAPSGNASSGGEAVVMLDWADASGVIFSYTSAATIAQLVLPYLLGANPSIGLYAPLAEGPIHLLGHSRGAPVVSDLARRLGQAGVWVDQLTTLDPYPVNSDPTVVVYDNVVFAENDYQTSAFPDGTSVTGAHNTPLTNIVPSHTQIHTYYHGTIDTQTPGPVAGDAIDPFWYSFSSPRTGPRNTVGYAWSRFGGRARPADGVAGAHGGSATRSHVAVTTSAWPNVGELAVDTGGAPVRIGDALDTSFRYQDADSAVTVSFYLDPDHNAYNGNDRLIDMITPGPFTGNVTALNVAVDTSAADAGTYYLRAQISDGVHSRHAYAAEPISLASLDVDGSGAADALTDGILATRRLFGFTGDALAGGAVDSGATRTDPAQIAAYLDQARPLMLDVDANGAYDALTDGTLLTRYLFGFRGAALVQDTVDPAGGRTTAGAITAFLDAWNPNLAPPSPDLAAISAALATRPDATTSMSMSMSTSALTSFGSFAPVDDAPRYTWL